MFWNVCIANDFFISLKILFGFCNEMNCCLLNIIIIAYQQKKLGILQSTFYQSSLFFYDYTIFHLLIASKIAPKSIDIISIFLSVFFFQSAIKNLQWTAILLRVPSYYPTFSPTTIIYEHIHAIVLLSVYLQYSIHFNLWFSCYQRMVTTFPLLKTIKWRKRNCNYQGMFMSGFVRDILIKMRYIF